MIAAHIDVPEELLPAYQKILMQGHEFEKDLIKTGRSRALYLPPRRQPTSVLRRDAWLAALYLSTIDAQNAARYSIAKYIRDRYNEITAADFKPEFWQQLLQVDNEIGYSEPTSGPSTKPPRPGFFMSDRIATTAEYTVISNKYFALDQGGGVNDFQPGFVGDASSGFFLDKQYAHTITTFRTEYAMVPEDRLPTFTIVDVDIHVEASDRGSRTFLSVMFKPYFDANHTPTPNNPNSLPGHGKTFYWKWKRPTPQTTPYTIQIDRQLLATAHEAAQWNSLNCRGYQVHTGPLPPKGRLYANNLEVFIDHRTKLKSFQPSPCIGTSPTLVGYSGVNLLQTRDFTGELRKSVSVGSNIVNLAVSQSRTCALVANGQLRLYDFSLDELTRFTPPLAPGGLFPWRGGFVTTRGGFADGVITVYDTNLEKINEYPFSQGLAYIFVGDYQMCNNNQAEIRKRADIRTGQRADMSNGDAPKYNGSGPNIATCLSNNSAPQVRLVTGSENYGQLEAFPHPVGNASNYLALTAWQIYSNGQDPTPGALGRGTYNKIAGEFSSWANVPPLTVRGVLCQLADLQ